MVHQFVCVNCKERPCHDSNVLCNVCENDHGGWTEMDKTETHCKRDKKGNRFQRQYVVKIRKLRNDYRMLKVLQRDLETLKKKVFHLEIEMEMYQSRIKCLEQNESNEKTKTSNVNKKKTPLSASTPIYSRHSCRPKGRDTYRSNNSTLSPIHVSNTMDLNSSSPNIRRKNRDIEVSDNSSDNENKSDDSDEEFDKSEKVYRRSGYSHEYQKEIKDLHFAKESRQPFNFSIMAVVTAIIFLVAVVLKVFNNSGVESLVNINIKDMKENFPHQIPDTWDALESGINEVKKMNKPSVFLLVYNDSTEVLLTTFVKNISTFASCVLNNNCNVAPVQLKGDLLDSLGSQDYGYLIEKFRPELEEKSIMVIYNLEKVPGDMAQAFHSFCDEYNPLVKKSVYFFTMKINKPEGHSTSDIERILRSKWSSLKDDTFDPLFTRISSMIIPLEPEQAMA